MRRERGAVVFRTTQTRQVNLCRRSNQVCLSSILLSISGLQLFCSSTPAQELDLDPPPPAFFFLIKHAITNNPTVTKKAKKEMPVSHRDSVLILRHAPGVSSMAQSQWPSPWKAARRGMRACDTDTLSSAPTTSSLVHLPRRRTLYAPPHKPQRRSRPAHPKPSSRWRGPCRRW